MAEKDKQKATKIKESNTYPTKKKLKKGIPINKKKICWKLAVLFVPFKNNVSQVNKQVISWMVQWLIVATSNNSDGRTIFHIYCIHISYKVSVQDY